MTKKRLSSPGASSKDHTVIAQLLHETGTTTLDGGGPLVWPHLLARQTKNRIRDMDLIAAQTELR
jgi:hypothetical protein